MKIKIGFLVLLIQTACIMSSDESMSYCGANSMCAPKNAGSCMVSCMNVGAVIGCVSSMLCMVIAPNNCLIGSSVGEFSVGAFASLIGTFGGAAVGATIGGAAVMCHALARRCYASCQSSEHDMSSI